MRVHVLGLPHTQTTEEFTTCAFTMKARNLCKMLTRRGHHVTSYGVEIPDALQRPECAEHVAVMSEREREKTFGRPGTAYYNTSVDGKMAPYHALFARNLNAALRARTSGEPFTEIVCQTWNGTQQNASAGIQQHWVESGIGYNNASAKLRVYESYAWMHFHLGRDGIFEGKRWYWAVIPNAFDLKNFTPNPDGKRGEEFLFVGRLNEDKGIAIACDLTKRLGAKLCIVGQGDPAPYLNGNPHVRYLPPVGIEERRELYANARAVFCITQYVEPFGGVAVEAQLSGTPVITSDHGVFNETVLHGVTGYRGRAFEQWLWAAKNIDKIDGRVCRQWAEANYSLERVALMYEEFFQQILDLRTEGFYKLHPERTQLDWLVRKYPQAAADVAIDLERPHEAPAAASEAPAVSAPKLSLRFYPPEADNVRSGLDAVLAGSYDVPGLEFDAPPRILDLGAHVGSFAVWAAARWPGAKIVSYEPHPDSAEYCHKNTKGLAEVVERAVVGADCPKRMFLYEGVHNTGQRSLRQLGEQKLGGVSVRTTYAADLPPAEILKIDTEGCELEIVREYPHLAGVRCLMLEWHSKADYDVLLAWVPTLGLSLVRDDTGGAYAGDRNLVFVRKAAPASISFVVRVHNEAATLALSLASLFPIEVPLEIVVVLHRCTDASKEIAHAAAAAAPARHTFQIVEYDVPISRAGLETCITPSTSRHSLVQYYTYAFNLASSAWRFKWDGDFLATPPFVEWINSRAWETSVPTAFKIGHTSPEGVRGKEGYFYNCLTGFSRQTFWEVPLFDARVAWRDAPDGVEFVHQSYSRGGVPKDYWRSPPWFAASEQPAEYAAEAEALREAYTAAVAVVGPEPTAAARSDSFASDPAAEAYYQACRAKIEPR